MNFRVENFRVVWKNKRAIEGPNIQNLSTGPSRILFPPVFSQIAPLELPSCSKERLAPPRGHCFP